MQFTASYSTRSGFQSSGSGLPIPTQKVPTATPVQVGGRCPSGTVATRSSDGRMTCMPPMLSLVRTSPVCPTGTIPVPLPNGTMACVPPPSSGGNARSTATTAQPTPLQASSLKRYALWGAIGLVGAIVIYKMIK